MERNIFRKNSAIRRKALSVMLILAALLITQLLPYRQTGLRGLSNLQGLQSMTGAIEAKAAEQTSASSRSGSLLIEVQVVDNNTKAVTRISGVQLAVLKIAALDRETRTYTMDPAFASQETAYRTQVGKTTGNIFDGMTASQSNTLAKLLAGGSTSAAGTGTTAAAWKVPAGASATRQTTDAQGQVRLTGLSEGMYLVIQTGASNLAAKYTSIDPFLVAVPMYEDGTWKADVTVEPKTSPRRIPETEKPPTPETQPETKKSVKSSNVGRESHGDTPSSGGGSSSHPQTGDNSNIETWAGLLLLSGVAAAGLLAERRRRRKL